MSERPGRREELEKTPVPPPSSPGAVHAELRGASASFRFRPVRVDSDEVALARLVGLLWGGLGRLGERAVDDAGGRVDVVEGQALGAGFTGQSFVRLAGEVEVVIGAVAVGWQLAGLA